jgi:predicted ester cyclase
MTREDIREFFEKRQEQWNARDADALANGHAENSTVVSPMFGTLSGRPAIAEAYRSLYTVFPDWTLTIEDLLVDGDQAAQLFSVTATHVGEFMGLTGTNRRFQIQGVRIFRMGGGLIQHERRLYDFTGLLIQVGVLRGKPAK